MIANIKGFKKVVETLEDDVLEELLKMYINVYNNIDSNPQIYGIAEITLSEMSNRYADDNE